MSHTKRIPQERFKEWAEEARRRVGLFSPVLWQDIARAVHSDIGRFAMQRSRGYVDASYVLSYARELGLSPVAELRLCMGIDAPRAPLPDHELEALIPAVDFAREMIARVAREPRGPLADPGSLEFRRWLIAGSGDRTLTDIRKAAGLSPNAFARKNLTADWSIHELAHLSAVAGLDLSRALFAAGWITWEETGESAAVREDYLGGISNADLAEQLRKVSRILERQASEGVGDGSG